MPVVINGSTGISGNDGTAAVPTIQGTDGNTGMFFPAADTVAVASGGSERMRIASNGDVSIGPSATNRLNLSYNSISGEAAVGPNSTGGNTFLTLGTSLSGSYAERARITSGGDLLVGSTSSGGRLSVLGGTSGSSVSSVYVTKPNGVSNGIVVNSGTTSTDPAVLVQTNNGTTAYWLHNGDIYLPGGTAGVKTVSDKRLKRDVTYLTEPSVAGYKGLDTVMALKPVTFRFKTDDDAAPLRRGWIADDFAEQMPELVTETKIPGGDEVAYKSVADGGLIPVLVSALKELKAENDALKARVAALEAR